MFVEGHGGLAKDLHCKLADGVALMTFSDKCETYEQRIGTNALYAKLADVSSEWMLAADALLGRILADYGFPLADE